MPRSLKYGTICRASRNVNPAWNCTRYVDSGKYCAAISARCSAARKSGLGSDITLSSATTTTPLGLGGYGVAARSQCDLAKASCLPPPVVSRHLLRSVGLHWTTGSSSPCPQVEPTTVPEPEPDASRSRDSPPASDRYYAHQRSAAQTILAPAPRHPYRQGAATETPSLSAATARGHGAGRIFLHGTAVRTGRASSLQRSQSQWDQADASAYQLVP